MVGIESKDHTSGKNDKYCKNDYNRNEQQKRRRDGEIARRASEESGRLTSHSNGRSKWDVFFFSLTHKSCASPFSGPSEKPTAEDTQRALVVDVISVKQNNKKGKKTLSLTESCKRETAAVKWARSVIT